MFDPKLTFRWVNFFHLVNGIFKDFKCLNEIGPQVVVKVAHNKHPFDYGDLRSVPVWLIVAQDLVFAHALGKLRSTVRSWVTLYLFSRTKHRRT